jgi:Rrf2 family protein
MPVEAAENTMLISQKCQYGLRALFELARSGGAEPVSVRRIAKAQAIPPRFLEIILGELKQAGFVVAQRGARGGYLLARDPQAITVAEVIHALQGEIGPVHCLADGADTDCALFGDCIFLAMWEDARAALMGVFDNTTFADLVAQGVKGNTRRRAAARSSK